MSDKKGGNSDCVKVAVRCRPLSSKEVKDAREVVVDVDTRNGAINLIQTSTGQRKPFAFDNVFPPDVEQSFIFTETAKPVVDAVLEGYNGTVFAYGQTGTGPCCLLPPGSVHLC